MNKTKIEWTDYTWNPVTGCLHECPYCYARRVAERFGANVLPDHSGYHADHPGLHMLDSAIDAKPYPWKFEPTFHAYKLDEPTHKTTGVTIFVGSMTDLFGEWVPDEWIAEVFAACKRAPQHTYLFLTKNPARYLALAMNRQLPECSNMWYGTTTTTQEEQSFCSGLHRTFLSVEPILGPFDWTGAESPGSEWLIMGAMTGPGAKQHAPRVEWIENICRASRLDGVPVFMKDSLADIVGADNMLRQIPEGIKLHKKEAQA